MSREFSIQATVGYTVQEESCGVRRILVKRSTERRTVHSAQVFANAARA